MGTARERKRREAALRHLGFKAGAFESKCPGGSLKRASEPSTVQVNIGLYCNQACAHCHVESSPLRKKEQMSRETVDVLLEALRRSPSVRTLDITGGAPELNAN